MDVIYENNFLRVTLENNNTLIRTVYKNDVDYLELNSILYKEYLNIFSTNIQKFNISKAIIDERYSEYFISEDTKCQAKNFAPRTVSLDKVAFISSQDYIANISKKEMILLVKLNTSFVIRYFDNIKDAEQWIND